MIDHPYIADPEYSTTVIAWFDGGLHFFRRVPANSGSFALFNVFHLAYGIIFLAALWWCHRWWRRGTFRVQKRQVLDSVLVAVVGIVVGGRLGEAVFYQPEYYFSQPLRLITNASGFTIHGMIIGVVALFWLWSRWIKRPWFHLLDQSVIFVAFGTPLGRVANFLAGDLWGRETSLPWGVRFPMRGPLFREVVANQQGETFMVVRAEDDAPAYLEPWVPDQGYELLPDAPLRVLRVGAPDSEVFEVAQMVATTPRHPSQLYQAIAEGLVLLVILLLVRRRAKWVGELSAWFLVGYGLLRLCTEFFRQPEPGLGFLLGLTRGQFLSIAMVASGAVLFWWVRRRRLRIDSLATDAPGFEPKVAAQAPSDPDAG
jgi:phosphatidylglycerol:prolipoprotein diacylglycerol transferase